MEQDELLAMYPMVEKHIYDSRAAVECSLTTDEIIASTKSQFDRLGPFEFARRHDLLVKNSGEEFAIQFMSFYNSYAGRQVY